jgi:hypothetical protein
MKIITLASSQTFKVIPRNYVSNVNIVIRDEQLNKDFTFSTTASTSRDILSFTTTYTSSGSSIFKEGRFYDLTVKDSSDNIIYKDKIFSTAQTINQSNNNYYDINKDEYDFDDATSSHDTEYIIV